MKRYVIRTVDGKLYETPGYRLHPDIQRARIWTQKPSAEGSIRHQPGLCVVQVVIQEVML